MPKTPTRAPVEIVPHLWDEFEDLRRYSVLVVHSYKRDGKIGSTSRAKEFNDLSEARYYKLYLKTVEDKHAIIRQERTITAIREIS